MADHDIRPRVIDAPREGFWLAQFCRGGAWCPVAIMRLHTISEPGQSPINRMDRSSFLAAFISGLPAGIQDVWLRRGRVITRSEYDRAITEIADAVHANRYDPRCQPFKPVAIEQLDIPFSEEADAHARRPNLRRMRKDARPNS